MKQHITITQLKELSLKTRHKLNSWYQGREREGDLVTYSGVGEMSWKVRVYPDPKMGDRIPLLMIGQMIEFLDIHIIYLENEVGWWGIHTTENLEDIEPVPELADALWEAVKEVLGQSS